VIGAAVKVMRIATAEEEEELDCTKTLRVTPAMAAGIADKLCSMEEVGLLLSALGQLKSAARRWSAEARFWPFVLVAGVLVFGGLSSTYLIAHDLLVGNLSSRRLVFWLAFWPVAGLLWGAVMWLYLRDMKRLLHVLRRR
jgi:hypothetical protein